MSLQRVMNDSVPWFMDELGARVVAKSGIPSDRYHLGKLILQSYRDAPDFVAQIDGATGESETNSSLLRRSVCCANCFKNVGLQNGDVMVLMAPNHIDLAVPLYAALYLGIIVAAVDRTLIITELQNTFNVSKPKIVFCQSDIALDVQKLLNDLALNAQIVTFDKGDYFCNFTQFMEKYGGDSPVEEFEAADFNSEESISFLIPTSGTTGKPKAVAATHKT